MFSHVSLGTNKFEQSVAFYDALLEPLGLKQRQVTPDGGPLAACWIVPGTSLPRFYLYMPFNNEPATAGNGTMVAFRALSPASVDQAFSAALLLGGKSEGDPGPRPHYGESYYGAYLRDLDGNKLHLVYREDG